MDVLSDYEIFLRNGTSLILTKVRQLDVESETSRVTKLNISGSDVKDTLVYLDVGEIICIVKRNEYPKVDRKRKWWKMNDD